MRAAEVLGSALANSTINGVQCRPDLVDLNQRAVQTNHGCGGLAPRAMDRAVPGRRICLRA